MDAPEAKLVEIRERRVSAGGAPRIAGLAVNEFAGVAADAQVDGLQQVLRAGRDDLAAVVNVHDVVLETDADEERRRQVPEEISHEALVCGLLNHDCVRPETPNLLWVASGVGAQASDRQSLVAVEQLGQPFTKQ